MKTQTVWLVYDQNGNLFDTDTHLSYSADVIEKWTVKQILETSFGKHEVAKRLAANIQGTAKPFNLTLTPVK